MRLLWVDPEEQRFPELDRAIEVDVAVIGGGLSGIGAAHALAQTGAEVALLEGRTLGSGASGRNGGFCLAGPAMNFDQAVAAAGPDEARSIWEFTEVNNAAISDLVTRYEIDCGFLRRGSMSLSASEAEWGDLDRIQRDLEIAGINSCLVKREQLPRPFDRMYTGGLYYAGNAELNSGVFVRGVGAAIAGNVRIFERSPVMQLRRGSHWELETERATVLASKVVLATNAWTPRLLPAVPIQPTRGQVVATVPLDRAIVPFPMYADHGYQYWRQTADFRLVVGGWRNLAIRTEETPEEELNPQIQAALEGFVQDVVPGVGVERRWAGIMGFTPDMFPLVGAVPGMDGVFISAGFSGHGVSMAFTCGERVARRAIGQEVEIPAAFNPARFPALGLPAYVELRTLRLNPGT